MLYLLTFGPLLIIVFGWFRVAVQREHGWPRASAFIALSVATANALISSGVVLYYAIHPVPPHVPPWEDGQILYLSLQLLSAPVAMLIGLGALIRGAPKWLVVVVEIASIPMCVIGFLASCAV